MTARAGGGRKGDGAPRAAHQSTLYGRFSRLYDVVLARVFVPRVTSLVRALALPPGARVLEVGVGTGGSLAAYPTHCEVVGVDLSEDMLRQARRKIARRGWTHVRVEEADATDLPFPDDAFDHVMAFHVVTVVTEPGRLMRELLRVCRPGGQIAIVNRFRSDVPLFDRAERAMEGVFRHWGWTTMRLEHAIEGHPLEVLGSRHGGPFGLFTALLARNRKPGRGGQDDAEA